MLTQVTSGVKIAVVPHYEPKLSCPVMEQYLFSYYITIVNGNDFPIQLLRRHWYIFDSFAVNREVEGPGVIGEHPILQPGESYSYQSACDLKSLRGTMRGFYSMRNLQNNDVFRVNVPLFRMEVPYSLN